MTDRESGKSRLVGWSIVAGLAVLALSALLIPRMLTSAGPSDEGGASPTPSVSTAAPLPPTPSVWPTPAPGSTAVATPQPPVAADLQDDADLAEGVHARVKELESVEGAAQGSGEISGPAIRVTIEVTNETSESVDLSAAVVNLAFGSAETPGAPVSGPGVVAFPASLAAADSASGTFVFTVPLVERDHIRITLDASATTPMIVFSGVGPG